MAVSLNANYMRSDYMLSDAALPMRLEEMEQAELMEQGAKFAEILGGIGDKPTATADIPDEQATMPESEQPIQFESTDELAQKIASGEIQLSDIPKELITKELLEKVAKLIAKPEQTDKFVPEKDELEQQAVIAEFVAAYAAQESAPADKSAELNELAAMKASKTAKVEAVQVDDSGVKAEASNVKVTISEMPVIDVAEPVVVADNAKPQQFEAAQVQTVQVTEAAQTESEPIAFETVVTTQAVEQAAAIDGADDIISAEPMPITDEAQPVQQSDSYIPVQDMVNAQQTGHQQSDAQQNSDANAQQSSRQPIQTATTQPVKAEQTATDAVQQTAYADAAKAMETVETRTVSQQTNVNDTAEQTVFEKPEQPTQQFAPNLAAKSERVVSKESELSMIRHATRPATQQSENTAAEPVKQQPTTVMAQPMAAELNTPVTFTRADGSEIEVRPGEVLQQVTENISELAEHTTAEGGTEYKVTLTPEDLGTITVKMTKAVDGSVTVSITADNAKTQRILEEHSAFIQSNLRNNGVELENWQTVNESQQEPYAEDYNGSSRNPYHRQDEGNNDENAEDMTFADIIASM